MDTNSVKKEEAMKNAALFSRGFWSVTTIGVCLICLLASIAMIMVAPAMADGEKSPEVQWEQYKSEDGIIGYKRNVEGSKFLETRAETIAEAPIEVVLDVLVDIPTYPQWMHACKDSILLKLDGELKRELYFAQGVPLGSPDRDTVIRAVTHIDWDTTRVKTILDNLPDHPYQHPVDENDRERQAMKKFEGLWDLEKLGPNRTKVTYTAYTEPGGFAPKFVVNRVIRKVTFGSVKGLLEMAKNEKYLAASDKGDAKAPWKQSRSEDGVTGYERDVAGSRFLETRAETAIEAPVEVVVEVLKDIASYPQWMHNCKEVRLLKEEGDSKKEFYYTQGVPLGFPGHEDLDRDTVLAVSTAAQWDKNRVVTTLESIDNHPYQCAKNDYEGRRQRMIKFKGEWNLEMLDRNRTKATFTTYIEPGGLSPKFIVNNVIRDVSFGSVKGLATMAKDQKYVAAAEKGEFKKKVDAAANKN
jgi:ribosome-associated toxin RatA of RatAB toxin-antitoxin module